MTTSGASKQRSGFWKGDIMRDHTRAATAVLILVNALGGCGTLSEYDEPPAATYSPATWEVATDSFSEMADGAAVSAEFFPATKAQPYLGRFFHNEENAPDRNDIVVLSHDLWQRRFDSRPDVIGRQIRLNGRAVTIIGVAPPGFGFPDGAALWVPRT